MRIKSLITYSLIIVISLLGSCKKDDEGPKFQFSFEGQTYSLKGAKAYLTFEGTWNNHGYRNYYISDGEYKGGDGNSLDDYDNATYILSIQLLAAVGEDFIPGEYQTLSDWSTTPAADKISSIFLTSGVNGTDSYTEYFNLDSNGDAPLVVSGGFEDGDKMTLKFSGTLNVYHKDEGNWIDEPVTGKFNFSGRVQDEL